MYEKWILSKMQVGYIYKKSSLGPEYVLKMDAHSTCRWIFVSVPKNGPLYVWFLEAVLYSICCSSVGAAALSE